MNPIKEKLEKLKERKHQLSLEINPILDKKLSNGLTDIQWGKLKNLCKENEILLNNDSLEYGSEFLTFKYWFVLGWEARDET